MRSADEEAQQLALRLAAVEAKALALEQALERRSAELIALQPLLDETQLRALARITAGRSVGSLDELRHPFSVEAWEERPTMTPAEVPEALDRLWETIDEESLE